MNDIEPAEDTFEAVVPEDLFHAYLRDQSAAHPVLSPQEEHALFQNLERQSRFAHNFKLKHPIALVYVERLYARLLPMPSDEAAAELSLATQTDNARPIPEQLQNARLATFLEYASDHRLLCEKTKACLINLREARRLDSPALPDIKAAFFKILAQSADLIKEMGLVPGHFLALSQLVRNHCAQTAQDLNPWPDSELARLDPKLGLTQDELKKRLDTLCRAEAAAESLRNDAIESNLRLVVTVALRYQNRGLDLVDLIQEGNLGLMKAVDRFDYRLGNRFSTYAVHWIQQAIKQALLEQARPIRLPQGKAELLVTLSRTTAMLTQKLKREPNVQELAHELHMSPAVIAKLLALAASPLSLQKPLQTDQNEDVRLEDVVADDSMLFPDEIVDRRYLKDLLPEILKVLSEPDRKIIELRYGIGTPDGKPMTLAEVARIVTRGVNAVHHRQIEAIRKRQAKALRKLQHPARMKLLT